MAKLVIIEGMRGTGKTYLASRIREKTGAAVKKFERGVDPIQDMIEFILFTDHGRNDQLFVFDRFHLTEMVHRLWDGSVRVMPLVQGTAQIHKMLSERNALMIYTFVNPETIYARLDKRENARKELDIPYREAKVLWQIALNLCPGFTLIHNDGDQAVETAMSFVKALR